MLHPGPSRDKFLPLGRHSLTTQAINVRELSRVLEAVPGPGWYALLCVLELSASKLPGIRCDHFCLDLQPWVPRQVFKCESCHCPLVLYPDCLPPGQGPDLIEQESDPLPGLLLSCSLHSGGWSGFLREAALCTVFLSRHSEASTHSIQGCYENQMCFIYKSLCSSSNLPKKKNCKQRMQIIFQIDRFMKMPVFILSFLKTRESHKRQFQKP